MPQDKKNQPPDFEKSLAELEKIVQRMERGEQSLEQTLKDFERGMVLSEAMPQKPRIGTAAGGKTGQDA